VFAGDRSFSQYDKDFDFEAREESIGGSSATPNGRISSQAIDYDGDGMPDGMDPRAMALCGAAICQPNGMGGWKPFMAPDDLYNYQPSNYLYTPSQRYNVYGAGNYSFTKSAKAFFEGSYMNRKSDQQLAPEPFIAAVPISVDNMYNNTGGDVYDYRRRLEEFGPRKSLQNVDTFRIVTGVSGKTPSDFAVKDWKWELSYNYGHTVGLQRNEGNLILSRLANALGPSFIDGNGTPRCGTAPDAIPGCVPMNIMGPSGSISSDQKAYVTFTGVSTGFNDQKTALAQTAGRIAKLPNGGDISLAVGGDYRREEGGFTPDPLTSTGDTTGNAQAPTGGSYDVFEGYGELSLVPLSGKALAQWVEIDLAARAFKYSTFGSGVTWKAGGLFKTAGGVALRGTYSTAFRAPSVGELYAGKADDFPTATDPCDASDGPITDPVAMKRCGQQMVPTTAQYGTSQQRAVVGGNPNLDAETAKVFTAGLVYEPPQVKGLSFTLDYFHIKIDDAIQALGAQVILANCYTRDIQEDCDKIHRDPQQNYAIDFIEDGLINVGGTTTDGLDFAIAYDHKVADNHFRHQLEGQYLHKLELDNTFQKLQGVGFYDLGVYPKIKANYTTTWEHKKGYNAGINFRYVGGYKECQDNDCNTKENLDMFSRDVKANVTADLFGGYMVKSAAGTTRVTVGVNNLLNQNPSLIYVGFAGDSDASTYDYMGRYFYARLSQLF
jgi:outer membrane receptor protein involved in Fe transport